MSRDSARRAWDKFQLRLNEKESLEVELAVKQAELDKAMQATLRKYTQAHEELDQALSLARFDVTNGKVRPAVVRAGPDLMIVAIGDDKLWVRRSDGEHVFGPPDEQRFRVCEDQGCYASITWPSEPLAVIQDVLDGGV